MAGRFIAIGDIHGCSVALESLLQLLRPTSSDTIVTLGDYVNRGPDSRGVLTQLIALRERCPLVPLLGNHDDLVREPVVTELAGLLQEAIDRADPGPDAP